MENDFSLNGTEIIFLVVAVLVTVPILIFVKWILKELKKEQSKGE